MTNEKFKYLNIKSLYITTIIFLFIFSMIFNKITFIDEIVGIISLVFVFILFIEKKINGSDFYFCLLLFLAIVIGLVSNFFSLLNLSKTSIFIDIITSTKVLFTYLGVKYFITDNSKKKLCSIFYPISKLYLILSFVFFVLTEVGVVSLYGSSRYGLPCYNFIFPFAFQYTTVQILALYFVINSEKNKIQNNFIIVLGLISLFFNLKSTSIVFVIFYLILCFYLKNGKKINIKLIVFLFFILISVGSFQIKNYLTNENAPRYLFYKYAYITAKDYFPFGSGFATYGSSEAAQNYSPLYKKYGFNNKYGMSSTDGFFLSDNFWPTILGQFGMFGCIIYLSTFWIIFKDIGKIKDNFRIKSLTYSLLLQYIIQSVGSSILGNTAGQLGFIILGIILFDANNTEKKNT